MRDERTWAGRPNGPVSTAGGNLPWLVTAQGVPLANEGVVRRKPSARQESLLTDLAPLTSHSPPPVIP